MIIAHYSSSIITKVVYKNTFLRIVSQTHFKYFFLAILFYPILLTSVPVESVSHSNGGTLIIGRGGDTVGLDPAHEVDGESFKVCDNIYDTLV